MKNLDFISSLPISSKVEFLSKKGDKFVFWSYNVSLTKSDILFGFKKKNPDLKIKSIRTMNFRGKKKRFKMTNGVSKDRKKVIITFDSSGLFDIEKELFR